MISVRQEREGDSLTLICKIKERMIMRRKRSKRALDSRGLSRLTDLEWT